MRNSAACVSDPNSFSSVSGDRFHVLYNSVLDDNGLFKLVEVDRVDMSAQIQSQLPFTDMSFIVSRLAAGDSSVLSDKQPLFGDFSKVPTNLTDAYNLLKAAERNFYSLKPEVRAEFNGSFTEFLAAGTKDNFGEVLKDISIKLDTVKEVAPDVT